MSLQYNMVCFTARNPRRWVHQVQAERPVVDLVAAQLVGQGTVRQRVESMLELVNRQDPSLIGVAAFTHSLFVVWSGVPSTALRWDRLTHDSSWDRYEVSVYPTSDAVEVRWDSGTGEVRRHVVVSGGRVEVNDGDGQVVDEDADDDRSLLVDWGKRLPAKTTKKLLDDAAPEDISRYDGRRYVRTDDPAILSQARVVRQDKSKRTWVAVDQKGPINTLRDPLIKLPDAGSDSSVGDVEKLADRMVRAWFGFSMLREDSGDPPTHVYPWPDENWPQVKTVLEQLRQDPSSFFSLLAECDTAQAAALRLAEQYDLPPDDAASLLDQPIRTTWPSTPADPSS